jgi:hypothetical protein
LFEDLVKVNLLLHNWMLMLKILQISNNKRITWINKKDLSWFASKFLAYSAFSFFLPTFCSECKLGIVNKTFINFFKALNFKFWPYQFLLLTLRSYFWMNILFASKTEFGLKGWETASEKISDCLSDPVKYLSSSFVSCKLWKLLQYCCQFRFYVELYMFLLAIW